MARRCAKCSDFSEPRNTNITGTVRERGCVPFEYALRWKVNLIAPLFLPDNSLRYIISRNARQRRGAKETDDSIDMTTRRHLLFQPSGTPNTTAAGRRWEWCLFAGPTMMENKPDHSASCPTTVDGLLVDDTPHRPRWIGLPPPESIVKFRFSKLH